MARKTRLSYQTRVRLIALAVALCLSGAISAAAYFGYHRVLSLQSKPIQAQQSADISHATLLLTTELGQIRNLIKILRHSDRVRKALSQYQPVDHFLLGHAFSRFGDNSPLISQIRWLDDQGQEQVRVDFDQGKARVADREELQSKQHRYYVTRGFAQEPDSVYLSPIDLNKEHGLIEIPLVPTLRATLRTSPSDRQHDGLLVINLDLRPLFDALRTRHSAESRLELLGPKGYWLLADDENEPWGQILDNPESTLAKQAPQLWQRIQDQPVGPMIAYNNRYWSWSKLPLADEVIASSYPIYLVTSSDAQTIPALKANLLPTTLAVALLTWLSSLWLLYRFMAAELLQRRLYQQLDKEHRNLNLSHQALAEAHSNQQLLQDELVESRKLSSLGMMVAGVAHELNTPTGGALMVISSVGQQFDQLRKGISQHTDSHDLSPQINRIEQGLELAKRNLSQLNRLITGFKRLAIDRAHEDIRHFQLHDMIHDLELSLGPRLKQSPVKLRTEIEADLELTSSPGILSQVLQNLIENAVGHAFHTDQPGQIDLKAHKIVPDQLELQVVDDGRGIEPTLLTNLFDPFVTSSRGQGHTGLGLHLVHQWVHHVLQGTIDVQSTPGQGTLFTIRIPMVLKDPAED
ncbi:sensor histidine kinase [Marinobacterium litorale]|uniref:sensor histidine kinase n=1 Tax=Marinobacterium litorale TaxID=404770 RepID=UPI0004238FB7|nr:HAMP domain-containing sensor histidine kinase [Marinobacterium litorale]